jgi:hypothetical protein
LSVSTNLRRGVFFELGLLRRLVVENQDLLRQAADAEPGRIEVMAVSAVIHSFYCGVENVFQRVAKEIDGGVPVGGRWHADLLDAMSESSPRRPALISSNMRDRLLDFMSFRHMFRHIYTTDLEWNKMAQLAGDCEETLNLFTSEIESFFADDNGGT